MKGSLISLIYEDIFLEFSVKNSKRLCLKLSIIDMLRVTGGPSRVTMDDN